MLFPPWLPQVLFISVQHMATRSIFVLLKFVFVGLGFACTLEGFSRIGGGRDVLFWAQRMEAGGLVEGFPSNSCFALCR